MSTSTHPPVGEAPRAPAPRPAGKGPLDLTGLFDDARFLSVGCTGFLGKVWLCMLLTNFPNVQHVWTVVRSRRRKDGSIRQSSVDRFWSEVVTSPVFDPLREKYPGAAFESFIRSKLTPIDGDITREFAGVSQEVRDELRGTLTALVNASGVVDFNPPLDYALNTNAFGMQNLVALCRDLGAEGTPGLTMLHTSTCYVAGDRTGQVDEVSPLEHLFPKAAELDPKHWDAEREISECLDLVDNVRHRANDAFRQNAFLDEAKKNLERRNEPQRGTALERELAKVTRKFVDNQLVEWGTERAKYWGWHNIYTYTKSIGEQILARSGLRFAIGRPAVIESAETFPRVGWNEGINTSAPLIYLGMVGPYEVPSTKDSVLDVIPVDHVAAGMMVTLGELLENTHKPVYQYGSSEQNPLRMYRLIELVGLYKRRHYGESGKNPVTDFLQRHHEINPVPTKRYFDWGPTWRSKQVGQLAEVVDDRAKGMFRDLLKPVAKSLSGLSKGLAIQARITDQFVPFTATHNYRFSTANTRAAWERLPEELRDSIVFAPQRIDWRDYIMQVHNPGLQANVFPLIEDKMKKTAKPLANHDDLLAFLDEIAERHDRAPALLRTHEDGFARLSYVQLKALAEAVAVRLASIGVKPGDRVILSGKNHPHWVVSYFGILRAGAVAVPLDVATDGTKAEVIFASAEPVAAIVDSEALDSFGSATDRVTVVDLNDVCARGATGHLPERGVDFEVTADTLASILYTSGTTGDPKGVMLTHGNFCAMMASIAKLFPLEPSDRLLSVLPLHHAFEFTCGMLMPLSQGARIIYLDEVTGDRLSYGLQEGRVTAMVGVPALWQLLERRIRGQVKDRGQLFELFFDRTLTWNRNLGKSVGIDVGRLLFGSVHSRFGGNVRLLISGGAALPKDTQKLFSGLGLHLSEGYGLTEASPVLTVALPGPGAKTGTVGKPVPGVEVKINEPDDSGIGEVWAKGPNVMTGYFGNPSATKGTLTDDGWLRTGDMGKLDHKGRLTLVGRAKEVVVTSSGENIYLDDVEHVLGPIQHVEEYSLVGLDDERGGERLGLLARPDPESKLDHKELHSKAELAIKDAIEKLPPFQRPAVVHLVDAELPRTATRKIQRKEVRRILERIVAATPTVARRGAGVRGPVIEAIAAVAGVKPAAVAMDTDLRATFGYDSLMWVELASALEHVGEARVDADSLSKCVTAADVVGMVGAPPALVDHDEDEDKGPLPVPEVIGEAFKDTFASVQAAFNGPGLGTKVYGRAYIPQNRQTIVVCNHTSHLDMGLVKYALGDYGRRLAALGAQDYFFEGNRLKTTFFKHLTNVEPIDRKSGFRASLRMARKVLGEGKVVLLFPEGTRQMEGELAEFKPLVGKLALDCDVDILPLHIEGAYRAMPKGNVFPTRRGITVRIGPALEVSELRRLTAGLKPAKASRKVSEITREAVARLREGDMLDLRQLPDDAFAGAAKKIATPAEVVARCMASLPERFVTDRYERDITWYFSLGGKDGPRAALYLTAEGATWHAGRPSGDVDCVVKTSVESLRRMVEDGWVPDPSEFFNGNIKTSDLALLVAFSTVFNLSKVEL
jgi:long-chain acyl-CoA synthetase